MHYQILNKKRREILPLFKSMKKDFYLAGGTALALQIGHRDSADFDFFSQKNFDTDRFFNFLKNKFNGRRLVKIQEEKGTLTIVVDGEIKVSFFYYPYPLIEKLINEENIKLASVLDIACMKLSAIVSRSTMKDYIDIYYVLQDFKLDCLLSATRKKMPELDENLVLKSLIYFDDILDEKIKFLPGKKAPFKKVKEYIIKTVKDYWRSKT